MSAVPELLPCPACRVKIEVSEEDPDASLSDLWEHLGWHTRDRKRRQELFVRAQRNAHTSGLTGDGGSGAAPELHPPGSGASRRVQRTQEQRYPQAGLCLPSG